MSVREYEESFSHMNWPPIPDFMPIESLWDVLEIGLKEWFDSPVIITKSNATLDGNKCCDIA